jgi:hypothetical protein
MVVMAAATVVVCWGGAGALVEHTGFVAGLERQNPIPAVSFIFSITARSLIQTRQGAIHNSFAMFFCCEKFVGLRLGLYIMDADGKSLDTLKATDSNGNASNPDYVSCLYVCTSAKLSPASKFCHLSRCQALHKKSIHTGREIDCAQNFAVLGQQIQDGHKHKGSCLQP